MSEKLENSKKNGPHHQLQKLAGKWEGVAKTWFEPTTVHDASPVQATIRPVLDGMYMLQEYTGSFEGKPIQGLALYGYNLMLQRFETVWVDSFHTGTAFLFSEGKRGSAEWNVKGTYAYVTPETEQYWGWRTTVEMPDDHTLVLRSFNVSPEGEEQLSTEAVLTRILE
jgi:hypothetical protein